MRFYVGTHEPSWLARVSVPLMVSARRLRKRRTLPRALGEWVLDSGGFTELSMFGRWTVTEAAYCDQVARFAEEAGNLLWAAPQDWMCEPFIVAKTGLSVAEHQRRTVGNYLRIRGRGPFIPVLQGWDVGDYVKHAEMYGRAGVDLLGEETVGIGSVCRRQNTADAALIVRELRGMGLRLHGFGFKVDGLRRCADALVSADSLAWSYNARRNPPIPGHRHARCSSCLEWALRWRDVACAAALSPKQLPLPLLTERRERTDEGASAPASEEERHA